MHVTGKEGALGVELSYEHNVGQEYNGEGGEEMFVVGVERLDAKLHYIQIDNDSNMEGKDQWTHNSVV